MSEPARTHQDSTILQPTGWNDLRQVCLVGKSQLHISSLTLLYRGSKDGWKFDDFASRCLGKGPTLTLVMVPPGERRGWADSRETLMTTPLIFGFYLAPALTRNDDPEQGWIADSTESSFVFSLVNDYHHAARFSFKDYSRVFEVSASEFGINGIGHLWLFGRPANTKSANFGFALPDSMSGIEIDQPKISFTPQHCPSDEEDFYLFSGTESFTAQEIEVFSVQRYDAADKAPVKSAAESAQSPPLPPTPPVSMPHQLKQVLAENAQLKKKIQLLEQREKDRTDKENEEKADIQRKTRFETT